ncbi:MAG: DUF1223 domain-containing protein [Acidobacteriota bacterium]|nr:DUF1223 domain-containing protein [Acidobacteriota bacterium]
MKIFWALSACFLAVSSLPAGSPSARVPVLVELFTSEGCSSCPPADQLLRKLDRDQPVPAAEMIVLSEHVDYWNSLGWRDPFSSPQFTERQREYAQVLSGDVYTPEMVVDGAKGFVGSDEHDVRRSVEQAARAGKALIRIEAAREDRRTRVSIRFEQPAEGTLYLALAHEQMASQVLRGENAGRDLSHVAVVYNLQKLGKAADRDLLIDVKPGSRIVAFVSKGGVGRVTAVGEARF